MTRRFFIAAIAVLLMTSLSPTRAEDKPVPPVLKFKMKSLAGQDVDLSKYQGKVILMVNTASKCGYTPQYKQLEEIYNKYKDKGLVVLGFVADNFGHQAGTKEELAACHAKYGVTFDLFSQISVKGDDKAPLFKYLTEPTTDPKFAGEIKWNFEKFLIDREGNIVARFNSKVVPDSAEVTGAIEKALGS